MDSNDARAAAAGVARDRGDDDGDGDGDDDARAGARQHVDGNGGDGDGDDDHDDDGDDDDDEVSGTTYLNEYQLLRLLQRQFGVFVQGESGVDRDADLALLEDVGERAAADAAARATVRASALCADVYRRANLLPAPPLTTTTTTTTTTTPLHLSSPGVSVRWLLGQRERRGSLRPYTCASLTPRFDAVERTRHRRAAFLDDGRAFCGKHSSDGRRFVSAWNDAVVRLYDPATWRPIKAIAARDVSYSIIDTDFSPDQRWLIYSSWSHNVHLCNVSGDTEVHEALSFDQRSARFCLFSVAFSPDSREILGGCSDSSVYIYSLDRRRCTAVIEAHADDVNAVCWADDSGATFFSGSDDQVVKLWDQRAGTGHPVGVLAGHLEGITSIRPRGDGRHVLTNSKDQSAKLFDVRRMSRWADVAGRQLSRQSHWDYRYGAQYVGDTLRKIFDGRVRHKHDASLMTYRGHKVYRTLVRAAFSPLASTASRFVYSGSADGAVHVWDTLTGELRHRLRGHSDIVRDVSWHPLEPQIVGAGWDGALNVWDARGLE